MTAFIIGIIWLILAFVLASSAKGKGRSYGAFLALGLFLSPLIGFIILIAMGDNKEEIEKNNISSGLTKKCPFCANEIKKEAIVCQYCKKDLPIDIFVENPNENGIKVQKTTNLLFGPSKSYNLIRLLAINEIVIIKESKNEWSLVVTKDGKEGWCLSENLEK